MKNKNQEEETFNLSEKIFFDLNCFEKPVDILFTKDVKEFIRILKRRHFDREFQAIILTKEEIDKLAGEDLK